MSEAKKRSPKDGPSLKGGDRDARKLASLILEVLAGELRPSEAAKALNVGLPRYYQMEKQALEGLLKGCEPRKKGRRSEVMKKRLEEAAREKSRLERELARSQALLRAAQKTVGVSTVVSQARRKTDANGRKRRKPEVRALKVARALTADSETAGETPAH